MAQQIPRLGAHLSTAGGPANALALAAEIGCDCLQIFVKNQRQWHAPPLSDAQIADFRTALAQSGVTPVLAHASYLLNLASPDAGLRSKSVAAMLDELERCEALEVDGLVFHPGAHLSDSLEAGTKRIAKSLDEIDRKRRGSTTRVLLETTAGQGTAIGYRFEQIAGILALVRNAASFGVCLDTCHLFAAGYDFRRPDGYASMIDELERHVGVANVYGIHVNDSKRECGSRVDRHEHIGKGEIGKGGFAHFLNDPRWRDVPFILETPKGTDGRGTNLDKVNLKRLRKLALN